MLQSIIEHHKNQWIRSEECTIKPIIDYIRDRGQLREPQINALETYLFLKIKGQKKPLWQLFAEGFFVVNEDLDKLLISQYAREILKNNIAAKALFEFSRFRLKNNANGTTTLFPDLEQYIIKNAETIDFVAIWKNIFYGIDYNDFLFSLPMGAGKTFLMASIIYLDLYFAENEPDNKNFAHNFIILVPSGLKSSIIPSIKTIEKFDPSWVVPEPAASNLKRELKFEVLDQQKKSSKEKRRHNPNAKKVNDYQPFDTLRGLVMVVNAEKVILDRLELTAQGALFEKTEDESDKAANELRNIIGKIPNLQIHIDEVHHAATDDIKLRQVVTKWNENGSINSVLGYSGTPYLSSAEKRKLAPDLEIKFSQITNTVFYYPLTTAIKQFLKKPRVEQAIKLEPLQIIKKGVEDFLNHYENKIYNDGTCAKLAIYCGSIEKLEEQIYPFLVGEMKILPDIILKYHKGNKQYKLSQENETAFVSLDTSLSKKKIVLLVQIGKEGWDCKSLTGVILSQKGDCPTNMVLQTSCRCLRQVEKGSNDETALIWLNEDNAKALDKQLKDEQQTSIKGLNELAKGVEIDLVQRFSRMDYLKLPNIEFCQLEVKYTTTIEEETPNSTLKINALNAANHFSAAMIIEGDLEAEGKKTKHFIQKIKGEAAHFKLWLLEIVKGSFNTLTIKELSVFEPQLKAVFDMITIVENEQRFFNERYQLQRIQSLIRLAFHCRRSFETKSEILEKNVQLLIINQLEAIPNHDLLYPNKEEVRKILALDEKNTALTAANEEDLKKSYQAIITMMESNGMGNFAQNYSFEEHVAKNSISAEEKAKNNTFHYLPYSFSQSAFELKFLKETLTLKKFNDLNLEIYYNGERHLTNFAIECYVKKGKNYQKIGKYTPDFLIIQRKNEAIFKILIIETKGSGFAEQTEFQLRKQFVENEFLKFNNEKANYKKFDYLFLQDNLKFDQNMATLENAIATFFK